jgi:hypothetical protein
VSPHLEQQMHMLEHLTSVLQVSKTVSPLPSSFNPCDSGTKHRIFFLPSSSSLNASRCSSKHGIFLWPLASSSVMNLALTFHPPICTHSALKDSFFFFSVFLPMQALLEFVI